MANVCNLLPIYQFSGETGREIMLEDIFKFIIRPLKGVKPTVNLNTALLNIKNWESFCIFLCNLEGKRANVPFKDILYYFSTTLWIMEKSVSFEILLRLKIRLFRLYYLIRKDYSFIFIYYYYRPIKMCIKSQIN